MVDRTLKSSCCSFIKFSVVDRALKSNCCSFTKCNVDDRMLKSNYQLTTLLRSSLNPMPLICTKKLKQLQMSVFRLFLLLGAQLLYLMTVLNFAGRALAIFNFSSQIFTFWDWNVPSCFQWPILKMVSMIACKLWHDPLVPAIIYHYE